MLKTSARYKLIFLLFLGIYFFLGLINLQQLPVAWTDEVLNIDPAIQFHLHGQFISGLWPNPGSDLVFASYLPLGHWTHTIILYFLEFTVFNIRLPYLILHTATLGLLFNCLSVQKNISNTWIPLLLTVLFAFDKSVFEISRSMRVEVPIMFLFILYLNLSNKSKFLYIRFFILGLLFMAHIYTWPIVIFWFIHECLKSSNSKKIILFITILSPSLLFLYQIGFNVTTLIEQLGMQTHEHRIVSTDLKHHPLMNSLWYRFFPHYREQPLMWLIYMGLLLTIPFILIKFKLYKRIENIHFWGWALLTIMLFLFASPQYRYLPPWLLLSIVYLVKIPQININIKIARLALLFIIFNGLISFGGRHIAALTQRPQRNPDAMLNFIHKNIPQNKQRTLIWGESIGSYYCNGYVKNLNNSDKAKTDVHLKSEKIMDYAIEIYPQHWKNKKYDQVFIITHDSKPDLKLITEYKVKPWIELPSWAKSFAKGGTYDGTKIYQISH